MVKGACTNTQLRVSIAQAPNPEQDPYITIYLGNPGMNPGYLLAATDRFLHSAAAERRHIHFHIVDGAVSVCVLDC